MFKNLRARKEEGFTLIELLITVVILAVLMGIAIPIYVNNKTSANSAAAKSEVHMISVAISGGIGTGDLSNVAPVSGVAQAATGAMTTGATALTAGSVIYYQGGAQGTNTAVVWVNKPAGTFCVSEGGWSATELLPVAQTVTSGTKIIASACATA